jgi:hypothetical protein
MAVVLCVAGVASMLLMVGVVSLWLMVCTMRLLCSHYLTILSTGFAYLRQTRQVCAVIILLSSKRWNLAKANNICVENAGRKDGC